MTAQVAERLIVDGQPAVTLCSVPLRSYFTMAGVESPFDSNNTALSRGYVGIWEVLQGRLYLVELMGRARDDAPVGLSALFPGFGDRVFAHWYSGTLRLPQGRLIEYVHGGFESVYERDTLLTVRCGVVERIVERENGCALEGAGPPGYFIAAKTTFPRRRSTPEDRT